MLFTFFSCLLCAFAVGAAHVKRQAPSGVPSYVLDYAPLVYLYTTDPYRPSDLQAQLTNTQPEINFTVVSDAPSPLTLDNLAALDADGTNGTNVYLTSKVNIQTNPEWLYGVTPDSTGETVGAVSCAIIVNDHGNGNVDVFYMYFYAYNYGGFYLGTELGDHVGDWEHNMIRFADGVPTAVWFSQHSNGEAFTYSCLQKIGLRPIVFSANGSHANYAINGTHSHLIPDLNLPNGIIDDYTDAGPLWDPTLSAYYYIYDAGGVSNYTGINGTFAAYDLDSGSDSTTTSSPQPPVNWLYFTGGWGDQQYPDSDPRQVNFLDLGLEYKYDSGPTGPEDKDLNRTEVCPSNGIPCILRVALGP